MAIARARDGILSRTMRVLSEPELLRETGGEDASTSIVRLKKGREMTKRKLKLSTKLQQAIRDFEP